jgi:uncharacterized membrane protein
MTWYDADGLAWEGSDTGVTYKGFWKSKTFWFNVLAVVVAIAGQVGFAEFEPDAELIAVIVGIVNVILRFAVKQPLTTDTRKVGTRALSD